MINDITVLMVAANEARNGGLIESAVMSISAFSENMPRIVIADNGGNGDHLKK